MSNKKPKEPVVEYVMQMPKSKSDKLIKLSEQSGEDNELAYMEGVVYEHIDNGVVKKDGN